MTTSSRDSRWVWLESIWQDGRHALRGFRTRPAGSLAVVGVLGLAIGITTAMFTVVDALFLRPVPFTAPDQLAIVHMRGEIGGVLGVAPPVLAAWKRDAAFSGVEAARPATALVGTDATAVKSAIARVTPGAFDLLGGVSPVRGRLFDAADVAAGTDDRVLLSEDVWRARFHADPALVGGTLTIDGRPATVVGILPSGFHFPDWNTAIWRATSFEHVQADARADFPIVYIRFTPRVPRADALRVATAAAREAGTQYGQQWAEALPLVSLDKDYQRAVPLFIGGVLLFFLGLCANASSLLLVGLTARGREFETRLALGAPRARLVRQALFESAAACAGGIAVGVGIGWALVTVAEAVMPKSLLLHSLNSLDIDRRALGVTSIASLAAMLCAGVLPALVGTRGEGRLSTQLSTRGSSETARARLVRRSLLVCQIAVSCTLLLGATLLVRSFVKLLSQDRGLDPSRVLVATVVFPQRLFPTQAARTAVAERIEAQARALPGVQLTSWSYGTPPGGGVNPIGAWTSDLPGSRPVTTPVNHFAIDTDFLALYGLPILQGRPLEPSDTPDDVLVSERFARALWPAGDAIGRGFSFNDTRRYHVIGIVKEIRYPSLDKRLDAPQIYGAFPAVTNLAMLSLRCETSCPSATLVQLRLAQSGADIEDVKPLADRYSAQLVHPRAAATLAFTFAATALIAAAAGVFSLLSHSVTRRRREIGIRTALGASPSAVRRVIWREGLVVTLPGIALGTLAGLWLAHVLSSLLFEVTPMDPVSWVVVSGVLAATMAGASWRPMRTAVRTSPTVLLREE